MSKRILVIVAICCAFLASPANGAGPAQKKSALADLEVANVTQWWPDVLVLIFNPADRPQGYRVRSGVFEKCLSDDFVPDLANPYGLYSNEVYTQVGARSWVARWVSTGLLQLKPDCVAQALVYAEEPGRTEGANRGGPLLALVRRPLALKRNSSGQLWEAGKLRLALSIVEEQVPLVDEIEPLPGTFIQAQVLVKSDDDKWARTAIVDRSISCKGESQYDWVVGPTDFPKGLTAGPVSVPPHGFSVFVSRLRGKGDPGRCRISLQVAQLVAVVGVHVTGNWRTLGTVSGPLVPASSIFYP